MVNKIKFPLVVAGLLILFGNALANETRMSTLMAGDYVEDIVYVDTYPQRLFTYRNNLYLDIDSSNFDFGIFGTPNEKYGAIGVWQNQTAGNGFNVGYAINLYKFDIGVSFSPVRDNLRFGIGVGRSIFNHRFDVSFLTFDGAAEKMHSVRMRYAVRLGDFNLVPRYAFDYTLDPVEYGVHRFGVVAQRMILNDGFVYFGGEYEACRGDVEHDSTRVFAGFELKTGRYFVFRCGAAERFVNGFENPQWQIEPGIGIRVRDFTIDLHLNEDRLFDKEQTIFKSFGLDLNFGRF